MTELDFHPDEMIAIWANEDGARVPDDFPVTPNYNKIKEHPAARVMASMALVQAICNRMKDDGTLENKLLRQKKELLIKLEKELKATYIVLSLLRKHA